MYYLQGTFCTVIHIKVDLCYVDYICTKYNLMYQVELEMLSFTWNQLKNVQILHSSWVIVNIFTFCSKRSHEDIFENTLLNYSREYFQGFHTHVSATQAKWTFKTRTRDYNLDNIFIYLLCCVFKLLVMYISDVLLWNALLFLLGLE